MSATANGLAATTEEAVVASVIDKAKLESMASSVAAYQALLQGNGLTNFEAFRLAEAMQRMLLEGMFNVS